jgi:hypothetical protein
MSNLCFVLSFLPKASLPLQSIVAEVAEGVTNEGLTGGPVLLLLSFSSAVKALQSGPLSNLFMDTTEPQSTQAISPLS